MLGKAAITMWWNMAASHRAEFEDWHTHEHFPERMGIPGFRRGSRWANVDGGDGFFVMYELASYDTLSSDGYVRRLNNPTPWSTKMMPLHRDMVRSQCVRLYSSGGGIGQYALTVRCSPVSGREDDVVAYLALLAESFVMSAGGGAFHVLRTETPRISATKEQQIRGGKDAVADWVVVATGYERDALQHLQRDAFNASALASHGIASSALFDTYRLAYTLTAHDLVSTV